MRAEGIDWEEGKELTQILFSMEGACKKSGKNFPSQILLVLKTTLKENKGEIELLELFEYLSDICKNASKPVALMIDEVDSASNNQVFLDFLVDMSFSTEDISGMLSDYENDFHMGMDIARMSGLIYEYTSGYPFLVSRICKLIDERIAGTDRFPDKSSAWTKEGFLEEIRILLAKKIHFLNLWQASSMIIQS